MKLKVKSGLFSKGTQTANWFARMFYAMAAAPVALLAEAAVKSSAVASAASGVIMLSIMAAIIVYSWAMFKSFHSCIFDGETGNAWKYVISKMAYAVFWLIALALTVSIILFMHMEILQRMPEVVAKAEFAQWVAQSVNDSFGKGFFMLFSAASLLFQAVVLITITYAAAVVSHLRAFERYKTLAGIFVFVLLYFFENDFAGALKRIFIHGFGGIEELLSNHLKIAIGALTGIEFAAYLIIAAINISITCYFLKKIKEG